MARQKKKKKHRLFWFIVVSQMILMLAVIVGFFYYNESGYAAIVQEYRKEARTLVRDSTEKTFIPSQTSEVYDVNGELISYFKGEKGADYVYYEDIPSEFATAMVSIEDKRFYMHNGIDFIAMIRSAKAIIESGSLSQGGSTITMQLARNVYLDNGKRMERKLKEIFIASELEKCYSKNKIMEFYLNNIYFANGYYGIQSACKGYFSCELDELSLSQIAFLCAIPNSPTYYDPLVNYENTIARRDRILSNMYEDGKISEYAYNSALEEVITLKPSYVAKSKLNNYVDTYVYYCATRALMEQNGFVFQEYFETEEERKAYFEEYDELYAECQKQIYSNGYKIYTSIDIEKQEILQNSLDAALAEFTELGEEGVYKLQGSAVTIDNDTGLVVAIVGGREQDMGYYTLNRAYQSYRQPGSAIKPLIVYTPFLERSNTPDTIIQDTETEDGPKMEWYHGDVTLRFAVEGSLNPAAFNVFSQITPTVGLQYLKNMHFSGIVKEDEVMAVSLGGFTKGVSSLEMAAAFATLENDGLYRKPTCVQRMEDAEGNEIYVFEQKETRIYSEIAAQMMTDVLSSAADIGTDGVAKIEHMPTAGKTGTTNDDKDGWFVGYTGYYTTAVWVGCDMPETVEGLSGRTYPVYIWSDYMKQIHMWLEPRKFSFDEEIETPEAEAPDVKLPEVEDSENEAPDLPENDILGEE